MIRQKPFYIFPIFLYCIGIIIGYISPQVGLNAKIQELPNLKLSSILRNNLSSIVFSLSGAFLFGCPTTLNLISNGIFSALIIRESLLSGITFKTIFLLVAPHGIFEIPAIIIAGAAGFKIPYEIIRYLAGKKEQPLTKEDIKEYLILALISIILIVIGGMG